MAALRARRLTISVLLVLAAGGAVALGVYSEAALLVVVFSLGNVLEAYVSDRARGSIRALMALAPPRARRRGDDGTMKDVPVEELVPGDTVVVRPGERVPTDGLVIHGRSDIDQAAVTGESMPAAVQEGSTVFGAPSTATRLWGTASVSSGSGRSRSGPTRRSGFSRGR